MKVINKKVVCAAVALILSGATQAEMMWSGTGNFGTTTANGDISASPEGGEFGYVSTSGGVDQTGLGLGDETNGSTMMSGAFDVEAGDELSFFFNYITSDGAGFADYAWAQLLTDTGDLVATLFTARSTPEGNTVPGFNLPEPTATLNPTEVTIIDNATVFSELGSDSGTCFDDGCGNTGWVESFYTISEAGSYILSLGVTNWDDESYDSALLFDNIEINDEEINPPNVSVPAPASALLLTGALFGLVARRRTRQLS